MGYVEEIDLTGFDEEVVEQKSLLKDTVGKREEEEREESYLDKDEEKGDDMENRVGCRKVNPSKSLARVFFWCLFMCRNKLKKNWKTSFKFS